MTAPDIHHTIDAVWRAEAARLIAGLARIVRDVGTAEDLAQDALVAALQQWPESGVPRNPGAWLMAAAKNRAIDTLRRNKRRELQHEEIGRGLGAGGTEGEAALDTSVDDDLLRLLFTACHPVLPMEARVALTLRMLGGLQTDEIARAFLVPEATMAQRIVRAKRTLAAKKVPFRVPGKEELGERLQSVLDVIYLIFNEGYAATAGEDWMRPALCEEALRLGHLLTGVAPQEAEAHGLVALMEIQFSRARARVGAGGEAILLAQQDRGLWDGERIRRGLAALETARRLGGETGPFALQAAIAACHARARSVAETDWAEMVRLYGELGRVEASPVVELNRAVAVGMAEGPAAGLACLDQVAGDAALRGYGLFPSVRADFLAKLGRREEARAELVRAAELTRNGRERALLLERARELG